MNSKNIKEITNEKDFDFDTKSITISLQNKM